MRFPLIVFISFWTLALLQSQTAKGREITPIKRCDWADYSAAQRHELKNRWNNDVVDRLVRALKEKGEAPESIQYLDGELLGSPELPLDLRGINLSGKDLSGVDLLGASFQGANLQFTILRGASLRQADLQGANLWRADLRGAFLRRANLEGANLSSTDLRSASFWRARLASAHLDSAIIDSMEISEAILENTTLYRPSLQTTAGFDKIVWINCYVGDDLATYRNLQKLYSAHGLEEVADELIYWENWVKTRTVEAPESVFRLLFLELPYGYGYRPWSLVLSSIVVIFFFGLISFAMVSNGVFFPPTKIYIEQIQETGQSKKVDLNIVLNCLVCSIIAFLWPVYIALKLAAAHQYLHLPRVRLGAVGWVWACIVAEVLLGIWIFVLFGHFITKLLD